MPPPPKLQQALGWLFVFPMLVASLAAPLFAQGDSPASEGRWYKGNLHTHSLWSDGNDFPEMIVDWYVRHGYDFLALSDHNVLSRGERWITEDTPAKRGAIGGIDRYVERFGEDWVERREREGEAEIRLKPLEEFRPLFERPGEFLLLEAEEITDSHRSLPIHVNATNVAEYIRPQGGESVRDTISRNLRAVEEQARRLRRPILAHLNHPNFGYAVTAEDMAYVPEERFFEIYNGHPSVNQLGDAVHASLEQMWDIANTIRIAELKLPPLYGLATDDSHNYFGDRGASPGRGWVMVRSQELEPESLLRAIYAGDFYSSSGVELKQIHWDPESGTLRIEIQAEEGVEYTTEFVGTRQGFDPASRPVLDSDGNELPVTRRYSDDIGRVFHRATGDSPEYVLQGDELYVRAIITSSRAHPNPSLEGQLEQAWVQPVTPAPAAE